MKARVKMTEITSKMKAYEIKFLNGLYFRVLNYGISVTDWGMGDQESWVLKHPKDETYLKTKTISVVLLALIQVVLLMPLFY